MRKGNTITLNTLRPNVVRMNGQPWAPGGPAVGGGGIVPLPPTEPEEPEPEEPEVPPVPTYVLAVEVQNGSAAATLGGVAVQLPYTANEGDTLLVTITPDEGYTFEAWADGATDNPRAVVMTADVTLSAACAAVVVPPAKEYIQFEDPEAERVLMANGVSSDGIGITLEDAARVTSIGTWFTSNTTIQSFEEMQYFTGVTSLSFAAFNGCSKLATIDLSNITEIKAEAFRNCTELSIEVIIPNVANILRQTFVNTKITKLVAENIVTIESSAFGSCASLKEVDLGASVQSIGWGAFSGCSALESVIVRATTPPSLAAEAFKFSSCPIYVPDASVEAYKTATNWNSYADRIRPLSEIEGSPYIQFEDPEAERVLMSKGVSSDGIGITKADAEAVTSIADWFKGNTSLVSFNEFKYFTNVKALSTSYAFSGCTNLQRVNLENIESMNSQVFNNSGIVELILPKIKSLVNSALVGMKSVTKVVIGASCESIEPNNIWSWSDKNSVAFILEGTTPPSVTTSNNKPDWYGVKFYVPDEAVEAYKAAPGWASWAGRIYPVSEYNG